MSKSDKKPGSPKTTGSKALPAGPLSKNARDLLRVASLIESQAGPRARQKGAAPPLPLTTSSPPPVVATAPDESVAGAAEAAAAFVEAAESAAEAVSAAAPEAEAEAGSVSVSVSASATVPAPVSVPAPAPASVSGIPAARAAGRASAPARAAESGDDHDLGSHIRDRARKVRSSVLAAQHEELSVLSFSTIFALVREAVSEAVQEKRLDLDKGERDRLLKEAEDRFNEKLASFKAEKASVEARAAHLAEQLERARSVLDEERQRVVRADQFTISDAGLIELDKRMSRLIDHAVQKGGIGKEAEEEMRQTISRLLDDERERISQKAREAQSESISLLERKIQRLASSLEETQKARELAEQKAHILEASAGNFALRNIMTAGLDDKDPRKEKKLALMKEIIEGNREVRQHISRTRKAPEEPGAAAPDAGIGQTENQEEVELTV